MAFGDREKRFKGVKRYTGTNLTSWTYQVENVVNNLLNGKSNNTGTVTLTASSGTTTVNTAIGVLGVESVILFMPKTANAATEFGSGNMYVSARTISNDPGTQPNFTITHSNNAQNDRTFNYVIIG